MDRELREYYEARFEMFSSKGWKDLVEDIEAMKKATDTLKGVKDGDDLHFKKGEISIMDWVLGLEDLTKEAFDGLNNDQGTV